MDSHPIHIIGGGLAGCEAAWQCLRFGQRVVLHEMRPQIKTFAHTSDYLAELVCSNSFRSDDSSASAIGLLHEEMRRCDSLIMRMADQYRLPAGSALAVDREGFSAAVTQALSQNALFTLEREELKILPDWQNVIIATGPLTSQGLAEAIKVRSGTQALAFFDAIAPIVYHESIDFSKAWLQSRYDKGNGKDYINLPLDQSQYERFIESLLQAEKTAFKDWEKDTPYFEGCLPLEVMAERGRETLRYGPLKPVGLTNPHSPNVKPYAVVQLRQDNALGTLFNMVGFQTKLTYGAQKEIFCQIPGLEAAQFARLGGIHRNTFINSPKLLDKQLRMQKAPNLRFAGQITGVEGYVESAAIGLLAGRMAAKQNLGKTQTPPPVTTALGALHAHITTPENAATFQPMNVNFGLFPDISQDASYKPVKGKLKGVARKAAYCQRALEHLSDWL